MRRDREGVLEIASQYFAVIARSEGTKQSIFDPAMPSHGLLRSARNDDDGAQLSLPSLPATNAKRLRTRVKRRSNPHFLLRVGLLRSARNDRFPTIALRAYLWKAS